LEQSQHGGVRPGVLKQRKAYHMKKNAEKERMEQIEGKIITPTPSNDHRLLSEDTLFKTWVTTACTFILLVLKQHKSRYEHWLPLSTHCVSVWRDIVHTDRYIQRDFKPKKLKTVKKEVYPLHYHALIMLNDIKEGGRDVLYIDPITKQEELHMLHPPHAELTDKSLLPEFSDVVNRLADSGPFKVNKDTYNLAIHVFQQCIDSVVATRIKRSQKTTS
jgi:hypothetical protein